MARCPTCDADNYAGEDLCSACGSDLRSVGAPQAALDFTGKLLGEHLDALGIAPPATVASGTSAQAAIAKMKDEGLECLLVVDGDRLVGIVTYQDALVKVHGRSLDQVAIDELMTPDPVILRHDDPIAVAIHKMAVGGFRHIPIVEDHRLVGLIASRDIFAHLIEAF